MLRLFDQTTFSDEEGGTHGDCCRACVASLMQIDAADLPHPIKEDGSWNTEFHKALRGRGVALRSVDYDPRYLPDAVITDTSWGNYQVPRLVMAAGMSPRGVRHSVIYDRLAERMVHDPHPSRAGLLEIEDFDYLAPFPAPTPEAP